MNFAHPTILWLLLIFPAGLGAFFWWSLRERHRLMTQFIQARLLPNLTSGLSPARQKIRFACLIGAVSFVILALARPQWGTTWEQSKQKGLDIVVAIDTSKSMLAEDIAPNRLTRAKLAALDLMQQAKSDRLGLVAFAGGAFLQCPLTIDDNAFRQSVEALDVNIIPQGGTALAEAINTAKEAFKEGDNFKVLVIFTDGEDNDEGAVEAATAAGKEGMKIFSIGIGTADGEILRMRDAKGRTDYVRDSDGNVVKSRLNERLLQEIASATEGGFYLPLRGAKTIDTLYENGLAPLPKSEGQEKLIRRYNECYLWPLAAAVALLLLEMLLPERRPMRRRTESQLRTRPDQRAPALTEAVSALLLCALLGTAWTANATPATAYRKYEEGKYGEALREYQRSLETKKDDPRLRFNAGAAAYRDGKFDEAAEYFEGALPAQDLNLQERAYYNLGNTLYRSGESVQDPKKKQESWETALKQFDSAMHLNTNNADAKFNYDFVKRRLEELKQQQQQQDKQDNKNNDKKDQDQNKDEQNKDQKDQNQDKKDEQKQDQQKQDEKKDQQQQQQSKNDEQKKDEKKDQQSGKQDQEKKQDEQKQQQAKSDDKSKESDQNQQREAQTAGAHAMTPQEAKQLLDAQKGEEKVLQFVPQGEPKKRDRALKDW
jgi:Ca-activated chloride channel family protein